MKKLLPAVFICAFLSISLNLSAQDYLITFAGTGAATLIDSVEVENLSTGKTITLNGSDILRLTSDVGISQPEKINSSVMRIYPNPMMDNSIISLHPPIAGDAVITVYEMTGKTVAQIHTYLENNRQEFQLSGLKNGMYLVNVTGNTFQYSGKILSSGQADGNPGIEKVSSTAESKIEKISKKEFSETQGTVDMDYTAGERLKFKAISGIYSTVKTDIPTEDKTLSFNFIPCTDGDGNNYSVVEIGGQIWMAENLKTIKNNNGELIGTTTPDTLDISGEEKPTYQWAYDGDESNASVYGRLYTWFAVTDSRNICPPGWHVPSVGEWDAFNDFGGDDNHYYYKIRETGSAHWKEPNLDATNEIGFTMLPGGDRTYHGTFQDIGYSGRWWSSSEIIFMDVKLGGFYPFSRWNPSIESKRLGFSVRCLLDIPNLKTQEVTEITTTTAKSGGDITDDWGYPITARGVCWSSIHTPTIADSLTSDGLGTGTFSSSITDLQPNFTYYIRSYATNSIGTNYGDQLILKTMTGQISDIDKNNYYAVTIGTQVWTAENLKTTKFNDGSAIPLVTDGSEWNSLITPGCCWYNNDSATYNATYGKLYNWYTVNTGKICPTGWHVPSDAEWTVLTAYLGGEEIAGGKLKEAGLTHWADPNKDATNESGFTALPGGGRYLSGTLFYNFGECAIWWSSTEGDTNGAWYRDLSFDPSTIGRLNYGKKNGFSVRCLQDQ